jgi:hypothetical protein
MPARSLQEHLSTAEDTARFAAHAQRLLRLQRLLETALPPTLRSHARVANLRQGKLIIHAANSAIAAKLRQFGPRFTELFFKDGAQISEIDVRVQAMPPSTVRKKPEAISLPSEERKQALTQLTDNLPADSPLKGPLRDLLASLRGR